MSLMSVSTKILVAIFLLSLPFLLETALEIYILTAVYGSQMLFFSVAHGALGPVLTILWSVGAVAYAILLLTIACQLVLIRYKRLAVLSEFPRLTKYLAVILPVHAVALASYEQWSSYL